MIPKIIHYCWFGKKEKPKEIARFVNEFKKLEPFGYKIIEWNEDNYDIKSEPFIIKAYNEKKWAHVSDFVRLDVLYKYGGIYLDTDVEIVKVFDDLLSFDLFVGFMWPCNLGTAVIGASKGNDVIRDLLIGYRKNEVSLNSPNNDSFTRYFINKEFGFKLNGKEQLLRKNIKIMGTNSFEQPSFLKQRNYTIHHFSQTWKQNSKAKIWLRKIIINFLGLYLYRKYVCYKALKISPFYSRYMIDIKR